MKKIPLNHVRIIGWTSPVLGILLILLGCWLKWFWLVIAALFVMLAAIIFLAIFNRCPHCGRRRCILPLLRKKAGGGVLGLLHCKFDAPQQAARFLTHCIFHRAGV